MSTKKETLQSLYQFKPIKFEYSEGIESLPIPLIIQDMIYKNNESRGNLK